MLEILKKYKFTFQLYNFFRRKNLSHNLSFYKSLGLSKKKYYSPVSSEDFRGFESPQNYLDKSHSSNELPKLAAFRKLEETIQKSLINWSDNGYAILENFFSDKEVANCNAEVDSLLKSKKVKWGYNQKIMDAFTQSKPLHQLASDSKLNDILQLLMGKEIEIFQTINFLKGSQQRSHSDSIHMTTFPYGNIIAVWVALEDVSENCGPLHYYPGSHKLPYLMNRDFDNVGTSYKLGKHLYSAYEDKVEQVLLKHPLEKKVFIAKKGDVLIWHANLMHGGEPQNNSNLSRKSMVLHYYSKDVVCFHEISQRPALKLQVSFD